MNEYYQMGLTLSGMELQRVTYNLESDIHRLTLELAQLTETLRERVEQRNALSEGTFDRNYVKATK